ncbi:hypothetical protein RP20_CCG021768 [Aedes albopictus]|nr:hypothetical protein RP20_CCG021768 [Aedes albopictus]
MDCNPEITEEVLEEASNNQPVVVTLPLDVYNEQAETIRTIQTDVAYIKEQFKVLLQHGMPEESIVDHSLFDTTEDPATLACAEFRYQMQHVCDRVRTSERRQSATTNRNPTSRKKLRVPLKVEFLNVHDDDEEVDKDAP